MGGIKIKKLSHSWKWSPGPCRLSCLLSSAWLFIPQSAEVQYITVTQPWISGNVCSQGPRNGFSCEVERGCGYVVLSVTNTPLQTENVSCVTTFQMHVSVFLNIYFYNHITLFSSAWFWHRVFSLLHFVLIYKEDQFPHGTQRVGKTNRGTKVQDDLS